MAIQMIKAYIGNKPIMVPRGQYVPGASPTLPTGMTIDAAAAEAPMIDAFIGDVAVKVPKGVSVQGASLSPQTRAEITADPNNVNPLYAEIDKMGFDGQTTTILKWLADHDKFYSENSDPSPEEVSKLFSDSMREAETDLTPYFDKVQSQDLDDLKTRMSDLRRGADRYKQQEALSYADTLAKTKESLGARGMTFSGISRKTLGNEGALDNKGVEGTIPTRRRYNWEDYSDKLQQSARDMGTAAERQYGSRAVGDVQGEFGNFARPYGDGTTYNTNRTSPLYQVSKIDNGVPQAGYVRSADQTNLATGDNRRFLAQHDLDRQRAIEQSAWNRLNSKRY